MHCHHTASSEAFISTYHLIAKEISQNMEDGHVPMLISMQQAYNPIIRLEVTYVLH